ncbi:WGR domain-containing protein [Ancylobacter polymorphus]
MARFYVASVEPSLLPGTALRRAWGRIGTQGRSRIDLFDDRSAAERALIVLKCQKLKRGYVDVCEATSSVADTTDGAHAALEPDTPP